MARSRSVALLIAMAALLVFANVSQADTDTAGMFRSGMYLDADLDAVLAARQADVRTQAWLEYLSLVIAGVGLVAAVRPPGRSSARQAARCTSRSASPRPPARPCGRASGRPG